MKAPGGEVSALVCPYCEAPAHRTPRQQLTCKHCGNRSYMRPDSFYDHVLVTHRQSHVLDLFRGLTDHGISAGVLSRLKDKTYRAGEDWNRVMAELEESLRALIDLGDLPDYWLRVLAGTAFRIGTEYRLLLRESADLELDKIERSYLDAVQAHEARYPAWWTLSPPLLRIFARQSACRECINAASTLGDQPLEVMLAMRPLPHDSCTCGSWRPGLCECNYQVFSGPR